MRTSETANMSVWVGAAAAATMVVVLVAGCAEEKDLVIQNLPPETYLAVADSVRNPTTYSQKLSWWGDDKDGEVIAFEYRWFIDPDEPGSAIDTAWVRTEEKSEVFDLPVTEGESVHRFEVRAIDNFELRDSTPCKITLPVTNSPPTVMIWDADDLPDTTLAAFKAAWHGSDPEGDGTISKYIFWLDGSEASAKVTAPPDTMVSLGREDFAGRYNAYRTLNLIAVDSGRDTSEVVTHTWYVKEPQGRVLLVDDLGSEGAAWAAQTDGFYRSGLKTCGEFSVLDLEKYGGMLAAHNFPVLFGQYDAVVWYNDPRRDPSARLPLVEGDLKAYVEDGGGLLLVSMAALGSSAALKDSLWPEVFGIDSLFVRLKPPTTNFDCMNWAVRSNTATGLDTLKVVSLWPGAECMLPHASATPLYYIPPGTVGSAQKENYYLGLMNSWQAGKAAILTFPLSRSDGYGNARREYCKVIELLLQ